MSKHVMAAFVLLGVSLPVAADMPVALTDMLKAGDSVVSLGTLYQESEADLDLLLAGFRYTGRAKVVSKGPGIGVEHGLTDRFSVGINSGYTDIKSDASYAGPQTVVNEARYTGIDDLVINASYKLRDGDLPLKAAVTVTAPTSSDSSGQMSFIVNGVSVQPMIEGDVGGGKTVIVPSLLGGIGPRANRVEWSASLNIDDDKSTNDAVAGSLAWLHGFSDRTWMRLGAGVTYLDRDDTPDTRQNDLKIVGGGLSFIHLPDPSTRLGLNLVYQSRGDRTDVDIATNNRFTSLDEELRSISVDLRFLF